MNGVRLTVRIDFGASGGLGPGKVRLLEAIHQTGSISQAGRSLGMSYRRAWLLVDDLNGCFREPVVATQPGGARGGGAALTKFGSDLVKKYRSIEAQAAAAGKKQLHDLGVAWRRRNPRLQKRLKKPIHTAAAR
jgi:molybdate transport system regulatory protein